MDKVDVNYAVELALSELNSELFRKNIKVQKNLGKNSPTIIDLGIERVLSNLIRNAIDASQEGSEIGIETYVRRQTLGIEITDEGRGIPQEEIERIFEPFYSTKEIDKGCGLGLTIVHEIVKRYNGEIGIRSALGRGTTFIIQIPLTQKND